jgi:membrane associated rhomboid family serine protease
MNTKRFKAFAAKPRTRIIAWSAWIAASIAAIIPAAWFDGGVAAFAAVMALVGGARLWTAIDDQRNARTSPQGPEVAP